MPLTIAELKTLDRLLLQVLDLAVDERAAWVDALPAQHRALAPLLRANLLTGDDPDAVETADFMGALPTFPATSKAGDDPVQSGLPQRL